MLFMISTSKIKFGLCFNLLELIQIVGEPQIGYLENAPEAACAAVQLACKLSTEGHFDLLLQAYDSAAAAGVAA